MGDLRRLYLLARAQFHAWRHHGRRLRSRAAQARGKLTSAALVILGLGGMLGGGALVGEWMLGLVLVAESAGALWFGLMRDDGIPIPRRGERTVGQVLEEARRLP